MDRYDFLSDDFSSIKPSVDVISDSDGLGQIEINGVPFAVGQRLNSTTWKSFDGKFRITADLSQPTVTLTIEHLETGSKILVDNWSNGTLGIQLGGEIPPVEAVALTANDDIFGETGSNIGGDSFDGLAGNDGLDGGNGDDVLDGGANDDLIFGGSGNDYLYGGDGNDTIVDGSELVDMRELDTTIGEDGKSEQQRFDEDIANHGASIVAKGKDWYIVRTDGAAATGNVILDGGVTIITRSLTLLDPNANPSGDDVIDAGAGSDRVFAGEGNDTVLGGIGDDYLNGGHDNDILYGGDGNDEIDGDLAESAVAGVDFTALVSDAAVENGNDTLDGGIGDDTLRGGGGNDILYGGAGNDQMCGRGRMAAIDPGDSDADYMDGGGDDDTMFGDDGDDTLLGGAGNDSIRGDNGLANTVFGNDTIDGGTGDDNISGDAGDDVIEGGEGADIINGDSIDIDGIHHGNDFLDGGAGNDTVFGLGGDDILKGGDGDDILVGDADVSQLNIEFHGNDKLFGGTGNDVMYGNGGNDTLDGGEGDDQMSGGDGVDRLIGGDGIDHLFGDAGDDIISGDDGDDILEGGEGNDRLSGGLGVDGLSGGDGDDILDGGADHDELHGGAGADQLFGGSADDYLWGDEGDDTLSGGTGVDQLVGGSGNDILQGEEGNDKLWGDAGDDVLEGGAGNDSLYGGTGINTYIVGPDSGNDYIHSLGGSVPVGTVLGGELQLTGGLTPADLSFEVSGNSIKLYYGSSSVVIENYFLQASYDPGSGTSFPNLSPVTSIVFDDGTIWDASDVKAAIITSTPDNDVIVGFEDDEVIAGGDGDDTISGMNGNDQLFGDAGNDQLDGGFGQDVLTGGAGDDTLTGGSGSDVYVFGRGDGQDTINNYDGEASLDALEFTSDVAVGDVEVSRVGDDLYLKILGTSDQVKVERFFEGDGDAGYALDEVRFADGTTWTLNTIKAKVLLGGDGDDVLTGYDSDDLVTGGAGNDTLNGAAGDDTIHGDIGQDVLHGGDGADTLEGGAGADTLFGDAGNDTLAGGAGTDLLDGGAGDDTYCFAAGDGMDTVNDQIGDSTLILANIIQADVYFRRDGENLVLYFRNSPGDQLTFSGQFDASTGLALRGLTVDFGDGTPVVLDAAGIDQQVLQASEFDDEIYGNEAANTINGLGGDDVVHAGGGNDTLSGGDGADQLFGDAGDDTVGGGSGHDHLEGGAGNDQLTGGTGNDQLFGQADDDVLSGGAGNDLLDGGTGQDQLTGGAGDDTYLVDDALDEVNEMVGEGNDIVRSQVSYTLPQNVETLELIGSANINATGNNDANVLLGNDGQNQLEGLDGDDTLQGQGGNDTILGGAGNDLLDGGSGVDQLSGGAGDDIFVVDNSQDVVTELAGEGTDTVQAHDDYTLSANIEELILVEGSSAYQGTGNAQDNILLGNTNDNRLDGGAGADTMTGGEGDDTYVVDNSGDVVLENAGEGNDTVESSIDYTLGATLENLTLLGTANLDGNGNAKNNILMGNAGDNRLDGGAGDDQMFGGEGNDTFITDSINDRVYEGAGEGTDTIERFFETNLVLSDNVENLVLADGVTTGNGNSLDNIISGNSGANTLGGWDGDDELQGLDGNDSLFGGNGSDHLLGGAGNDYLDGGAGADSLEGGDGDDTYIVDNSNDVVVEASNGGDDTVLASASYALTDNLETLFLTGNQAVNGTGNDMDNYIAGNGAQNVIDGQAGNDTLVGGAGDDTLIGGAGDDKYIVNDSSGSDVIDNTTGGFDGVFFTNGIQREQLSFTRDGDDLLIFVDDSTTPAVRVLNHFLGGDAAIDYVQPDGGYYLTTAEINQIVAAGGGGGQYDQVIEGTAAGEQLVGSTGKDLIKGLAGDDTLFGMAGDDTLQGGDGADYLAGGNGSGTGSGADQLEGGAGNDTLTGEDGINTLIGGADDDSYVYGGGQDTIDNTGGGYDGVFFNDGIDASRLTFSRDGDDLVITVDADSAKTVRVSDHFLGGDFAIDFVQPASGSLLDTAAINALAGGGGSGGGDPGDDGDYPSVVTGTASGEQLLGTNGRDLIKGLGGNDQLFGFSGDDKLDGGDGDDYLSGGNGGSPNTGDDILIGGAGVDTLVGEDGDDLMLGGTGDDNYVYGGGADTIDNTGGGTDWLFFNSSAYSVDASRISFLRDGDDLIVRVDDDETSQVRVINHYLGGEYALAYVQPAGGYAIPASNFNASMMAVPPQESFGVHGSELPQPTSTQLGTPPAMSTSSANSQLPSQTAPVSSNCGTASQAVGASPTIETGGNLPGLPVSDETGDGGLPPMAASYDGSRPLPGTISFTLPDGMDVPLVNGQGEPAPPLIGGTLPDTANPDTTPSVATGGELPASLHFRRWGGGWMRWGQMRWGDTRELMGSDRYEWMLSQLGDGHWGPSNRQGGSDPSVRHAPTMSTGLKPQQAVDQFLSTVERTGGNLPSRHVPTSDDVITLPYMRKPTYSPVPRTEGTSPGIMPPPVSSEVDALISAMASFSPDAGESGAFCLPGDLARHTVALVMPQ